MKSAVHRVSGDAGFNFGPLVTWSRDLRSNRELLRAWRADVERLAKLSRRSSLRSSKTLAVIDAMAASTPEEYHTRVQALGVSVQTRRLVLANGHEGDEKRFNMNGKELGRIFIPVQTESEAEVTHGPFTRETPATCDPEPCATPQEIEDALVTLYAAEAELAALESDMLAEYDDLQDYCSQNPWACPSATDAVRSGPSARDDAAPACWAEWANFAGSVVTANGVVIAGVATILAGVAAPIAALAVAATVVGVAGSLLWGWSGAISLMECKVAIVQEPRFDIVF